LRFIRPTAGFDALRVPAAQSGAGRWAHHRWRRLVGYVAVLCASAAMAPAAASAVLPPPAGTFTAVSIGAATTAGLTGCGLRTDQTIACWGDNFFGVATPPSGTFTQLDVDDSASACAVRTDQTIACWGTSVGANPPAGTFTSVAVETDVACALRTDATVTCWGVGTPFLTLPAGTLTGLAANGIGFCALNPDATVACWGGVFGGVVPTAVAQFSGGGFFNCAVLTDGTLACWGNPSAPPPAGTFLSVSTGASHACAVRTDHTVACWGTNTFGETQPPGGTFTAVSAGPGVSCGLRTDGTLVCWPGGAAAPGPAPPAPAPAPGPPAAGPAATPTAAPARLPRLPAAFGKNGVFVLPSNRSCVSRRNFRIRIRRQRAGVTLVSAAVSVNGRRVAVRRGARLTAPVDLRGLPRGRFTVRISALTADGRAISGTRRYRTCAPRSASGGHGPLVLAAALPHEGR
jgi:Regulator of chromosome condensation (RCC1) repeat